MMIITFKSPVESIVADGHNKALWWDSSKAWDIYVFTDSKNHPKVCKRHLGNGETAILNGEIENKNNDRIVSFTLFKKQGLKLFSSKSAWTALDKDTFPKYLINKIKAIPNEIQFIN